MAVLANTPQAHINTASSALDHSNVPTTLGLSGNSFSSQPTNSRSDLQRELASQRISPEAITQTERPSVENDPRFKAIRESLARFEREEIVPAQDRLGGARHNLARTEAEIENSGVLAWASGHLDAARKTHEVDKRLVNRREEHLEMLNRAKIEAQQHLEAAKKFEIQGRESEKQGNLEKAQELFNEAQENFVKAAGTIENATSEVMSTRGIMRDYQEANRNLSKAIERLDNTETVLRTTQKVVVIAGATIATGGVAGAAVASYGVVSGTGIAVATGMAYGSTAGAASAYTEARGHIAYGNKTAEQAHADAWQQTKEFSRESAIASVGTVAGMGVGGQVAKGVATRIVTQNGDKAITTAQALLVGASNGAAAGAANAAVSTATNTGIEYSAARAEFSQKIDSANLSQSDRDNLYAQFMKERGLDGPGVANRFAHDIGVGALGGAFGGGIGAGKGLAPSSRGAALSLEGGQLATGVGIGLGDATLSGQFNAQGISSSVAGSVVGTVSGRVSQRMQGLKTTSQRTDTAGTQEQSSTPKNSHSTSAQNDRLSNTAEQSIQNPEVPRANAATVNKVISHLDTQMRTELEVEHITAIREPSRQMEKVQGTSQEMHLTPSQDEGRLRQSHQIKLATESTTKGQELSPDVKEAPSSASTPPKTTDLNQGRLSAGLARRNDIMRAAKEAEPKVTKDIAAIASLNGGILDDGSSRLKSSHSVDEKIQRQLTTNINRDPSTVHELIDDSLRYTVTIESASYGKSVQLTIKDLQSAGYRSDPSRSTNFWSSENRAVYRGINAVFTSREGQRFEVQFHTPASLALRELNHPLYEVKRAPDTGSSQRKRLEKQMKANTEGVEIPSGASSVTLEGE